MERLTNSGTKEAKSNVTIKQILDKLAYYEDLDEKSTQATKDDWIPVSISTPDIEDDGDRYKTAQSKDVLVQTKKGDYFVARYHRTYYRYNNTYEYTWFSFGTGGRRMKVMGKVVAWQLLPEKYIG